MVKIILLVSHLVTFKCDLWTFMTFFIGCTTLKKSFKFQGGVHSPRAIRAWCCKHHTLGCPTTEAPARAPVGGVPGLYHRSGGWWVNGGISAEKKGGMKYPALKQHKHPTKLTTALAVLHFLELTCAWCILAP